jgi:hypothetical protein
MSEFELLDTAGDTSGKLRLIYGSGPTDPAPFVLTLTPQYVGRASGTTPPVSFHEIEKYAGHWSDDSGRRSPDIRRSLPQEVFCRRPRQDRSPIRLIRSSVEG